MSLPDRSNAGSFDALNKINDQNNPPANQALQWSNPLLARGVSDIAGLGLVSPRFTCRFTTATSTAGLVLLTTWAVWTNATVQLPTLSRGVNPGSFTITTPPVVSNEYDESFGRLLTNSVNFIAAQGNFESVPGQVKCSAVGNVITVNVFNSTGTPADLAGNNVFIIGY